VAIVLMLPRTAQARVVPQPSPDTAQQQTPPEDAAETVLAPLIQKAEGGDAEAQFQLAALYDNGTGVPKDHAASFKLCECAAEQGLPQAQYWLAKKYLTGEGVAADKKKGIAWLQKAANQGVQSAKDDLLRYSM
jgi:TPR repeat protein